jgi:hypothetical protein
VADFEEPTRQDGQEEPPDKRQGIQGHQLDCIPVAVIPPAKRDLPLLPFHEPVVGDGHAMRLGAHRRKDLFGPPQSLFAWTTHTC